MANFLTTKQTSPLRGEVVVPADKSISHRSLILGALTRGKLKITNFLMSEDCQRTLEIIKAVGGIVEFEDENTLILDASNCFRAPNTRWQAFALPPLAMRPPVKVPLRTRVKSAPLHRKNQAHIWAFCFARF